MNGTWIQTVSGRRVDLPFPKPEQIDIEDIAYALSMKCRFNGHTNKFYSVASHSIGVSRLMEPRLWLPALLHDANEAYLPDVPRPVKDLLSDYKDIEDTVQAVIEKKYGIKLTLEDRRAIKRADNIMLATEGRDFLGDTEGWGLKENPQDNEIVYIPEIERVRRDFLGLFTLYTDIIRIF